MMNAEFCPNCGNPITLLEEGDPARLCSICAWFGDESETLKNPPVTGNVETSVRQCLALYRVTCRAELVLEAAYRAGNVRLADMLRARAKVAECEGTLIALFRGVYPGKRIIPRVNDGMVPWPEDWTDRRRNGGEVCDMLVGPCSCGAWHHEGETWVQDILCLHNAVIEPKKPRKPE